MPHIVFRFLASLLIEGRAIMCIRFYLPAFSIGKQWDAHSTLVSLLIEGQAIYGKYCQPAFSIGKQWDAHSTLVSLLIKGQAIYGKSCLPAFSIGKQCEGHAIFLLRTYSRLEGESQEGLCSSSCQVCSISKGSRKKVIFFMAVPLRGGGVKVGH